MQKYKKPAVLFSILLAVAMPLAGAFTAHRDIASAPVVRFGIEPYDPRDLLYGQYMTFQIKWNWKQDAPALKPAGDKVCLCVGEGDVNPEVSAVLCSSTKENTQECQYLIPGQYYAHSSPEEAVQNQTFDADINRYYVDERFGLPLEKIFRQNKEAFSIGLGMKPNGKPVVESLYIDDLPLNDYLDANGGTVPVPEHLLEQSE